MTTCAPVGDYKMQRGGTKLYAKGKQVYFLFSFIPLGRTSVATPQDGSCMVNTRISFFDFLVTSMTAGLISMQTVRVYVKNSN
ncbi:MAG: hypothetical protein ACRCSB_06215 [Bacteroidales bacterium]